MPMHIVYKHTTVDERFSPYEHTATIIECLLTLTVARCESMAQWLPRDFLHRSLASALQGNVLTIVGDREFVQKNIYLRLWAPFERCVCVKEVFIPFHFLLFDFYNTLVF